MTITEHMAQFDRQRIWLKDQAKALKKVSSRITFREWSTRRAELRGRYLQLRREFSAWFKAHKS